jgi:hypothetical protein
MVAVMRDITVTAEQAGLLNEKSAPGRYRHPLTVKARLKKNLFET